jgi:hypothetical protein
MELKAGARANPLLRGVEGCVNEHVSQHTPAITHSCAPPLKRGVIVTFIFPLVYALFSKKFQSVIMSFDIL